MLIVAFLVVPVILVEESSLAQPWPTIAAVGNWFIWLAFFVEAVVMLSLVPNKWTWIKQNPVALPIVVLTPPFLPASLQALRVVRLLRLLRLVRAVRLMRRILSLDGLRWIGLLTFFLIVGGGTAFAEVEADQDLSSWDGVWWAVTTVTTVGYGDINPATDAGRAIAVVIMVSGIGFVALLTAAMAHQFVEATVQRELAETEQEVAEGDEALRQELREITERLQKLDARLQRAP